VPECGSGSYPAGIVVGLHGEGLFYYIKIVSDDGHQEYSFSSFF
jgi:hypothetical protein